MLVSRIETRSKFVSSDPVDVISMKCLCCEEDTGARFGETSPALGQYLVAPGRASTRRTSISFSIGSRAVPSHPANDYGLQVGHIGALIIDDELRRAAVCGRQRSDILCEAHQDQP
jgi:hypothetical protein